MEFLVDQLEKTDVSDEQIFDLLSEAYVQEGFTTAEIAASVFDPAKVKNRGVLFVAREPSSNELAGMVIVVPAKSQASVRSKGRECEMHLLGVYPKFRGKGLGRILVEKALDFAKANGLTKMILLTQKPMKAAQSLYASSGFINCDEMVKNGIEFLVYERDCT